MIAVRQAYNPEAPFIVASEELVCGARRLRRGEPFPWRDLGIAEHDLMALWIALKVDVAPSLPETSTDREIHVTPSARVDLEPPGQAQRRNGNRRRS